MRYMLAILFALVALHTSASNEELLIVEEIKKSIIRDHKLTDSYKIIETTRVEERNVEVKEKGLSDKLQVQKDQQRLMAQKKLGLPTDRPLTGAERVELLKEINRQKIAAAKKEKEKSNSSNSSDWARSKVNQQDDWFNKKKEQNKSWIDKKKEILASWSKAQKVYKKKIPQYKENLTPIPVPTPRPKKYKKEKVTVVDKKEIKVSALSDYHLVKDALSLPVRDQGKRPTCAAFAGVRAMEIKLNQNGVNEELSEQYFYFASKPNCQRRPCSKGGSWPYNAYVKSKKSRSYDIPRLSDCSYSKRPKSGNDTQIPLSSSCHRGFAKMESFSQVKSTNEILAALEANHPVVGGFKLSKNFYRNTGYVFKEGSDQKGLDSHAAGHAILLVGYIKLPKELQAKEGRYCFLTANSWGLGWGKGGHACLSEAWFDSFRYDVPFLTVSDVSYRNFD